MKFSIGKLNVLITFRAVLVSEVAVVEEVPIKITKQVLEEVEEVVKVTRVIQAEEEQNFTNVKFTVTEEERAVTIERPHFTVVDREIITERLVPVEKIVEVPKFTLTQKREPVKVPEGATFDVECPCGNKYPSTWTRCPPCGRYTSETLKDSDSEGDAAED